MTKIISWNIAHREAAWRSLMETDADVALLQEADEPPTDIVDRIAVDAVPWRTAGGNRPWRTAVARLTKNVSVDWIEAKSLEFAMEGELGVSRSGTIAAATITPTVGEPFIVVSAYAPWERPHISTRSSWIISDASVHRLISDLSVLIGHERGHRIVVAGDFNALHGYGESGNQYWAGRYASIFSRMTALGLAFVGPQAPAGRQADPWPSELPGSSKNVPTYHTNRMTPATAERQLDFVFASGGMAEMVRVCALNEPDQWGPSDHCRLEIEVG